MALIPQGSWLPAAVFSCLSTVGVLTAKGWTEVTRQKEKENPLFLSSAAFMRLGLLVMAKGFRAFNKTVTHAIPSGLPLHSPRRNLSLLYRPGEAEAQRGENQRPGGEHSEQRQ